MADQSSTGAIATDPSASTPERGMRDQGLPQTLCDLVVARDADRRGDNKH